MCAISLKFPLSFGHHNTHSVHSVPHAERWPVATRTAAPVAHDEIAPAVGLNMSLLISGITMYVQMQLQLKVVSGAAGCPWAGATGACAVRHWYGSHQRTVPQLCN
jgi:hypothetical protein